MHTAEGHGQCVAPWALTRSTVSQGHTLRPRFKGMQMARHTPPATRMEQGVVVAPSQPLMLSFTNTNTAAPHRAKANRTFPSRRCIITSACSSLWILESEPFNTFNEKDTRFSQWLRSCFSAESRLGPWLQRAVLQPPAPGWLATAPSSSVSN